MVSVIYHPAYLRYNFGPQHPFSPVRLEMLLDLLHALGYPPPLHTPPQATREEVRSVHAERFVARVESASRGGSPTDLYHYGLGTTDTPVFPEMDAAARWIVGGTLEGARLIATGRAQRVLQLGGGLHHAQYDKASGFCVYNDLAVAIRYLTDQGLRVAYIDIDVHHGDGVQWIFYDDPNVLTLSLHESGRYLFPGTGAILELGRGAGAGFKLNLPLEPFTEDASYLEVFDQVVPPALAAFRPDVLVLQCGADAHYTDPLADLLLTTRAYEQLFRRMLALAETHTEGRALFTLGGGYALDATARVWALLYHVVLDLPLPDTLPTAWHTTWQARTGLALTPTLHDAPNAAPNTPRRAEIERRNRQVAEKLLQLAGTYWR